MTLVRPFRGCRYNPALVPDLASVLCPPYDMIGPELHRSLQALSPYNAVHLEGGEQPDPNNSEAGYRQAAALFRDWLEEGVLRRDSEPGFYLMKHGFEFRGQRRDQLGLFGGVGVEDYDKRVVLPHEFTREPAVLDRVALLDYSKAQFSPIMTNYRDAAGVLKPVYEQVMQRQPELEVKDSPDGDIALWKISDPQVQNQITRFFADIPVFLADGHHRYEAALRYKRLQEGKGPDNPDSACNFVMMALVEFDDPGLLLLPYHRTVNGLSDNLLTEVREGLDELFEVQPVTLETDKQGDNAVARLLDQVAFLGSDRHALAMVGPAKGEAYLLMLRPNVNWQQWGELAISEAWVLEEKVLRPLLGDNLNTYVNYSHNHDLAVEQVNSGEQQLAFLLKPFPLDAFEAIVGGGQRLPSKSTFFYPKLPTGLVINQLEGSL